MARTRTTHIRDMVAGEVASDTREIFRVTSDEDVLVAVDRWDAYYEEYVSWEAEAENEGQPITAFQAVWKEEKNHPAPEFAAVADRDNISDGEGIFVEARFWVVHSDEAPREKMNAQFCQVNSTTIPGLIAGDLAILVKVYNARRTYIGMDPA